MSVATVSRVLNGNGKVSPEATQRVLAAADRLQYAPNLAARNLRRNESRVILILAPNLTNPYYANIIAGIGKAAHEQGYSSFLCHTGGEKAQEEQLLGMLAKHQADGAILMATELGATWLKPYAELFPLVQCSEFDPNIPIAHVAIDNYSASREAVAYLLSLNHKRIGLISSENRYYSTTQRLRGYRDALTAAGITPNDAYVRDATVDYTFKSGFDAATSLLSQEKRPTALFCISDMLALGAIASAREMGFRVPEDVSVVGFDDVEHTTMFHPHITTIAQPCYQLGVKAMEMLEGQINHSPSVTEALLPYKLMVRESTAARRSSLDFTVCVTGR